jgi:hypothetical protein
LPCTFASLKFDLPGASEQGEVKVLSTANRQVKWAVVGPADWKIYALVCFGPPDPPKEGGKNCVGGSKDFGDPEIATNYPNPDLVTAEGIKKLVFLIWTGEKGTSFPSKPSRPADFVGEHILEEPWPK